MGMSNRKLTMVEYVENQYQGKDKNDLFDIQMRLAVESDSKLRLIGILYDDTKAAMEECSKEPNNQFKRRNLVRTLFAHIECELSLMRQTALLWHRLEAIELTKDELQKLGDEITIAGDDSLISEKPKRLRLTDNIKFTFALFGKTPGKSTVYIDTNSTGWDSFTKSIKIRDRLMHPKVEEDLILRDEDVVQVMLSWDWFKYTSALVLQGNS
jgi:hypothetical protein